MLAEARTKRDLLVGIALAGLLALIVAAATWGENGRDKDSRDSDPHVPAQYAEDDESIVAYRASYGFCRLVPLDEIAASLEVVAEPLVVAEAMAESAPPELRDASFDACLAGFESSEVDSLGG